MALTISKRQFSAVILAGGSSTRMKGISKQQTLLCGKPAVVYSLAAFERSSFCAEIIVVAREDELPLYGQYKKDYHLTKLKKAVPGADTRQQSAFNGMRAVSGEIPYIAFHDAARCLVTTELIDKVFACALRSKCATAAARVTDTVKFIDKNGKTLTSRQPDRDKMAAMQTPQIFLADLYRAAAYTAKKDGFTATDDASLLEHAGFGVKTVIHDELNIKLTTRADLLTAEAALENRNHT